VRGQTGEFHTSDLIENPPPFAARFSLGIGDRAGPRLRSHDMP